MFKSKWFFIFRAFFPSWRFFDDVSVEFDLQVILLERQGEFLENHIEDSNGWISAIPQIERSIFNFPLNPNGNLRHAYRNSLNHLNYIIQNSKNDIEVYESAIFQVIENMARDFCKSKKDSAGNFKFRVVAIKKDDTYEVILESKVLQVT